MIEIPARQELSKLQNAELIEVYNRLADQFPDGKKPKKLERFSSCPVGVNRIINLGKAYESAIRPEDPAEDKPSKPAKVKASKPAKVKASKPAKVKASKASKPAEAKASKPAEAKASKPAKVKPSKPAEAKDPDAPRKTRKKRGTNLSPPEDFGAPTSCLLGSKQAALLDCLARPEGATMQDLLSAMAFGKKPWSEANIRSGFGCDMKHHGYGVRSDVTVIPERFYIIVPDGYSVVPHRPRKTDPS